MLLAPLGRDRAEGSPHSPRMPDGTTISGTLLILSIVAVSGLLLGHIQIRGAELGVSGVLFSGLAFGHVGARIDPQLALLLRDLGSCCSCTRWACASALGFLARCGGRACR